MKQSLHLQSGALLASGTGDGSSAPAGREGARHRRVLRLPRSRGPQRIARVSAPRRPAVGVHHPAARCVPQPYSRGDPNAQAYMWGMASQLSDDTIKALAELLLVAEARRKRSRGRSRADGRGGEDLHARHPGAERSRLRDVPRASWRGGCGRVPAARRTARRLPRRAASGLPVRDPRQRADHDQRGAHHERASSGRWRPTPRRSSVMGSGTARSLRPGRRGMRIALPCSWTALAAPPAARAADPDSATLQQGDQGAQGNGAQPRAPRERPRRARARGDFSPA